MSARTIKLKEIADARSGDKGASANIGILAHNEEAFLFLRKVLTGDRVQRYFQSLEVESVIRYELPNLHAFNFILKGALDGGASRSLRLDPQGKALGQALLEMELEE